MKLPCLDAHIEPRPRVTIACLESRIFELGERWGSREVRQAAIKLNRRLVEHDIARQLYKRGGAVCEARDSATSETDDQERRRAPRAVAIKDGGLSTEDAGEFHETPTYDPSSAEGCAPPR